MSNAKKKNDTVSTIPGSTRPVLEWADMKQQELRTADEMLLKLFPRISGHKLSYTDPHVRDVEITQQAPYSVCKIELVYPSGDIVIGTGFAKQNPRDDAWNAKVGANIACARAIRNALPKSKPVVWFDVEVER